MPIVEARDLAKTCLTRAARDSALYFLDQDARLG